MYIVKVQQKHLIRTRLDLIHSSLNLFHTRLDLIHYIFLTIGTNDIISNGLYTETCDAIGSPRRCGGQGDLLAGTLAAFLIWSLAHNKCPAPGPEVIAAWGACRLTRCCSEKVT
jgi:NAD(P)H-hydrate repair Nnr-like enzyme with NAD(P)H-hydrate dehydratase domain